MLYPESGMLKVETASILVEGWSLQLIIIWRILRPTVDCTNVYQLSLTWEAQHPVSGKCQQGSKVVSCSKNTHQEIAIGCPEKIFMRTYQQKLRAALKTLRGELEQAYEEENSRIKQEENHYKHCCCCQCHCGS